MIHILSYIHTYVHTRKYWTATYNVCMYAYKKIIVIFLSIYTVYIRMHVYFMYECMHVRMYPYVYVRTCIYMYVCMYEKVYSFT